MLRIDVNEVNAHSSYQVSMERLGELNFMTDNGILYEVSFGEDQPIAGCETYQIIIRKVNQKSGSFDLHVSETILAIIESFFNSNVSVLLYICDTSDGRQQARNKLFLKWLRENDQQGRYGISTCNVNVEGDMWYAAIILRRDYPLFFSVMKEFEEDAQRLSEKP